jgi:hypothetical protein
MSESTLSVRDFGFNLRSLDFFISSCNLGGEGCGLCAEYAEVAVKGSSYRCSTTQNIFGSRFVNYIVVNPRWERSFRQRNPPFIFNPDFLQKGLLQEDQDSNLEFRGLKRDVVYLG